MDKKYEILYDSRKTIHGEEVYRIRSLRNFSDVKAGDIGGFVTSEENLYQDDDCWIYDDAFVYDRATVCDNATIRGYASIGGHANVYGYATIWDYASIRDHATIWDYASIRDHATVRGYASIRDHATVFDHATVRGNASISDHADVLGNAIIGGYVGIDGRMLIRGDVHVKGSSELLSIGPIGVMNNYITFVKQDKGIFVSSGCFYGDINEFEAGVLKTYETDEYHKYSYLTSIKLAKIKFKIGDDN